MPQSSARGGAVAAALGAAVAATVAAAFAAVLGAAAAACGGGTAPSGVRTAGDHDVLFIGNSLTYTNDLPGTLAALATSGGETIRVASVTRPNYALVDHFLGGSDALATIARGGWEYVVLQQGPSSLPVNRDSLVLLTGMFDQRIRAAGGRTALFMVWPDVERLAFFGDVRASYQLAAQSVSGLFLPAGEAWRTAWASDPTLPLYGSDGYHPSPLGTYLAALVMYERITGRDARSLPAHATVDGRPLAASEATVRLLQRAAHETNARFPAPSVAPARAR